MNKTVSLNVATGPWEEIIHYVQYSTEIPIEFHIKDYSLPAGATARFYLKKPSGLEIYNECEIDGNTVTLKPTGQTFAESGKQSGQIQIVIGDKILVSYIIHFDIERNLIEESAIPSSDEFGVLDELTKNAASATADAKNAAASANTAAKEASAAAGEADTAAITAEKAATAANTAAEGADTAAGSAESAATAANIAARSANAATTAANTAAKKADKAAADAQEVIDTANERLVPQGGTQNQVLTKGAAAPEWKSLAGSLGILNLMFPTAITEGKIPLIGADYDKNGYIDAKGLRKLMGLGDTTEALPIANGGTGATSADEILSNLGIVDYIADYDAQGAWISILTRKGILINIATISYSFSSLTAYGNLYYGDVGKQYFPHHFTSLYGCICAGDSGFGWFTAQSVTEQYVNPRIFGANAGAKSGTALVVAIGSHTGGLT